MVYLHCTLLPEAPAGLRAPWAWALPPGLLISGRLSFSVEEGPLSLVFLCALPHPPHTTRFYTAPIIHSFVFKRWGSHYVIQVDLKSGQVLFLPQCLK